ncbi:hypothetical protein TCAL_11068 [Tigriopus californicus]|uniref:Uncharacterized protein n=1 Tax=Tigriopus californicus TaxID=6832 RepID=A0A553PLE5_TIGCA|nr:hypothetical protein TCAL_11068 [Tigriopus californicus]|eukprot:TCALIF_11068-PA protein Name:"Protein of unknown function" AED:0.08 eAED:0.08 QI:91/0.75/0.6/1/0.75/0.6/5/0/629
MPYRVPKGVPRGPRGSFTGSNRDPTSSQEVETSGSGRILSPNALRQAGLQKGGLLDTPSLLPPSLTAGRQTREGASGGGARGGDWGGSDSGRYKDGGRPRPRGGVPLAEESWPMAEFEERLIHGDIFRVNWNHSMEVIFDDPVSKTMHVALSKQRSDSANTKPSVGARVICTVFWEMTGSPPVPQFFAKNVREVKRKAGLPFMGHLLPTFTKMVLKTEEKSRPKPAASPCSVKTPLPALSRGFIAQRCQYNIVGEYQSRDETRANFLIHQKMHGEGEAQLKAYFELDKEIAVFRPGATKPEKMTGKELVELIKLHNCFTLDIMSVDNGQTWQVDTLSLKPEPKGDQEAQKEPNNSLKTPQNDNECLVSENALMSLDIIGSLISESVDSCQINISAHDDNDVSPKPKEIPTDAFEAKVISDPDVEDSGHKVGAETNGDHPSSTTDTSMEVLVPESHNSEMLNISSPVEVTSELEEAVKGKEVLYIVHRNNGDNEQVNDIEAQAKQDLEEGQDFEDYQEDDSVSTVSSSRSVIAQLPVQPSDDPPTVFPQEKVISISDLNANILEARTSSITSTDQDLRDPKSIESVTEGVDGIELAIRNGMEYVRLFYRFIRLPPELESTWLAEFERSFI